MRVTSLPVRIFGALCVPALSLCIFGAAAAGPPDDAPAAPSDDAPATVAPGAPAPVAAPAPEPTPPPAAATRPGEVWETEPGIEPSRDDGLDRERSPLLGIPIELSGYFWVDTGHMKRTNARQGQYDQGASYMQGRFVLAAEYYQVLGGLFAKARTELIGFVNEFTKSQFEAHVLDAFVAIGQKRWDVQVGRFLAWEVYHRGQGIELYTAEEAGALSGPALYWLDYTRGLKNEAGQLAFHLYPLDCLGIEVAGVYGQESNQNNYGVRPVVDFHPGHLQLIAGFEYLAQLPQTSADKVEVKSQGFAAKLQYAFPVVTVGADVAHASVDYTDIQGLTDTDKTFDKTSVGGFVDIDFWRNSIGLGYHYTLQKNKQGEQNTHQQLFVSYLYRLPIEGLSLKAVYGFALAHIEDADVGSSWENDMHSVRLRVAYDFK